MTKTLSNEEKKKILKDILGESHSSVGRHFAVFSAIMDYVGYGTDAVSFAELVPAAGRFLAGTGVSAVASNVSFASILLFPFTQMINIISANETGRRKYTYVAIAYTVVSWTFNDPRIFESKRRFGNLSSGFPVVSKKELSLYREDWREAMVSVLLNLEMTLRTKQITKQQLQILFKAISGANRQKLCLQIFQGFEREFSHTTKNIWRSEYKMLYPL